MKEKFDYYVGFFVSIFLSIRYLIIYGINVKGILVVAIIQTVFHIFYAVYSKVRSKREK